ncbi:MAG: DUF1501 domain-containing protein [Verrucomicrobia bacterium]|nr:DUF1501 domain-containing protein [Verrucomicrobiota bacterium]
MLTLLTDHRSRDCAGLTRRDFIRIGTLGCGMLALPAFLAARANAAATRQYDFAKDKSVVLLFLAGGASHIETFDPHMDAPSEIRSVTGEVRTRLTGVTFGGTFPRLAKLAHRMAVVRSFSHSITDHAKAIQHVLTAGHGAQISMGSIFAKLRGTTHERSGLPAYAALTSPEVDPQYRTERERVLRGSSGGLLGPSFSPFDPDGGAPAIKNMQLNIARSQFEDRRALLAALDQLNRRIDATGAIAGMDQYTQQAYDVILRGAGSAFDLSGEDPKLVERYDTSQFQVGKKLFRPSTLGRQMLLARRLCEAGCGFVTVQNAGWDMHADVNNPGMAAGMEMLGPPLDRAVSAFLEDVEARGLSDKILLVITGDFGRTPKINARGGRDHWANLGTLAFAGGGLRMGQVIGQSSRKADEPDSDPITPLNLMATIMHTLFDVGKLRVQRGVPGELLSFVESAPPIAALI